MTAALYIHIPFCVQKCGYCDFYSIPIEKNDAIQDDFIKKLCADIAWQFDYFEVMKITSVYIGGGTPSILGAKRIRSLLSFLQQILPNKPLEFTIEANPESLDGALLAACRDGGVDRISIGIQTFNEGARRAIGRAGGAAAVQDALALVDEYYPFSFSADLISGLPFQDETVLQNDIQTLVQWKPAHISLYDLCIEEGTPLRNMQRSREKALPSAETAERLWFFGRDMLEKAGYEQYEVSNFAQNGKCSLHNINYWRMGNWLGAGPAASGTIIDEIKGSGKRYAAPPDLNRYLHADFDDRIIEELNRKTLIKETMLMGFRYVCGPDVDLFYKRFSEKIEDTVPKTIKRWRQKKLLQNGKIALTKEGLLFLNTFLTECFTEIDTMLDDI